MEITDLYLRFLCLSLHVMLSDCVTNYYMFKYFKMTTSLFPSYLFICYSFKEITLNVHYNYKIMSLDSITGVLNIDNKTASESILYLQEYIQTFSKEKEETEKKIQLLEKENSDLKENNENLKNHIKSLNTSDNISSKKLKDNFDSLSVQKQKIEQQLEEKNNIIKT